MRAEPPCGSRWHPPCSWGGSGLGPGGMLRTLRSRHTWPSLVRGTGPERTFRATAGGIGSGGQTARPRPTRTSIIVPPRKKPCRVFEQICDISLRLKPATRACTSNPAKKPKSWKCCLWIAGAKGGRLSQLCSKSIGSELRSSWHATACNAS